jgi:hypothetical protein
LYRLSAGEPGLAKARVALWFAKPSGMTYENLYEILQPEVQQVADGLWQRQMTLGPTPEFCWHSLEDHRLPETFDYLKVALIHI